MRCIGELTARTFVRSVRGGPPHVHVAAADQPVHGGPRVHDGKYGHRSHVFLRGGHVQRRLAPVRRAGCHALSAGMCMQVK